MILLLLPFLHDYIHFSNDWIFKHFIDCAWISFSLCMWNVFQLSGNKAEESPNMPSNSFSWGVKSLHLWLFLGAFLSFTTKMLRLNQKPRGHVAASLTFCLLPPPRGAQRVFIWRQPATTSPVVWLPRKGENNKIERGKMKEIKEVRKLTAESKTTDL